MQPGEFPMEIKPCPYCGEPLHDYWGILRCQHCCRWIMEEELALCEQAQFDRAAMTLPLSNGDRAHPEQVKMGDVERTKVKQEQHN
jgi:hypothetical protein